LVDNESVDKICERIREDGEREMQSILDKARQTAADITAKAEAEGKRITEKVLKEAEEKGTVVQRRLLSSVNLEVRRAKLKAREEVVTRVGEQVEKELGRLREEKEYADVLVRLTVEAIEALDGDRFLVHADRRDLASLEETVFPAVRKILENAGRTVRVFESKALARSILGGVQVGVPGGNVIFDNTFEARLYRLRDRIRNVIFEEAFQ
jgi:V/A-type H+-transporting ATPase subunit E